MTNWPATSSKEAHKTQSANRAFTKEQEKININIKYDNFPGNCGVQRNKDKYDSIYHQYFIDLWNEYSNNLIIASNIFFHLNCSLLSGFCYSTEQYHKLE